MKQEFVLLITFALIGILVATYLYIYLTAGKKSEFSRVKKSFYGARPTIFTILLLSGIGIAVGTLYEFPIPAQSNQSKDFQTVEVTGYQWYWTLSQDEVVVGQPVEFLVTAKDVNHGFGIYDKDLTLITQAQAMPEYTNRLVYTFKKTGTYDLLCLEYCGLAHHNMVAKLKVVAAKPGGH